MPLVTTDNCCPGTPLRTPLHARHKSPYYVFSFSSFPVYQWSSPMSPVNSFPILFCGLSFAIHVASSTLAVYHPLLAPSLPGLGWKGHFPPRDQIAQDHFFSALDSVKHFCTMFWELGDILCYYRVLGQRQYAWSSSALFLRHRNNGEFLAGGCRFFYSISGRVYWLKVSAWNQCSMCSFRLDICRRTGSQMILPCLCFFLHQIFLVPHVNCIHFMPWPFWLCHYMLLLCFCAHLEVPDLVLSPVHSLLVFQACEKTSQFSHLGLFYYTVFPFLSQWDNLLMCM